MAAAWSFTAQPAAITARTPFSISRREMLDARRSARSGGRVCPSAAPGTGRGCIAPRWQQFRKTRSGDVVIFLISIAVRYVSGPMAIPLRDGSSAE